MIEFDSRAAPIAASHYRINSDNRIIFYRLIKGSWFYHHIDYGWQQTTHENSTLRKSALGLIKIPLEGQGNYENPLPLSDLYDCRGVLVPSRPCVNSVKYKESIIRSAISKLNHGTGCVFHSKSMLFSTLTKHYVADCDIYTLAKAFELDGWWVNYDFLKQIEVVVYLIELCVIDLIYGMKIIILDRHLILGR